MSAVLVKESLYQVFSQSDFVHSNTYAGNAMGAAAALATYRWMEENNMQKIVAHLEARMKEGLAWIQERIVCVESPRVIGGFAAFEITPSLFQSRPHTAQTISHRASQAGVFLRPLQNTVYWCPPLIMSDEEIDAMIMGTLDALRFLE
jgi:adenosylmethionine-8-amino-7-oxononanoate aminotransferase